MTAEIYALSHPVTREIRYIGKANDSKKRLASHLRDSRRRDTKTYRDFLLRGDNEAAERMRERLVGLAEKRPDVCGDWLKYKSISHCQ